MCCSLTKDTSLKIGEGKERSDKLVKRHDIKNLRFPHSVSTKFDHYCSPPLLRIVDSLNKAQGKWIKKLPFLVTYLIGKEVMWLI